MGDSDDDFELVQCEEILVSEEDLESDYPSVEKESVKPVSPCDSQTSGIVGNIVQIKTESEVSTLHPLLNKPTIKYDIRRKTRPIRLFPSADPDFHKRYSQKDEATKKLAINLLNIVKTVNSQRKVKIENGAVVPNFYLMATKCEPNPNHKVSEMDSASIVNLVKDIVHMIKTGFYRKVDYVEIICDSPAIFQLKYVRVKHWDSCMNSVYVVTSEYLFPYLCKIKAAEEAEENYAEIRNSASTSVIRTNKRKKCPVTVAAKKEKIELPATESSSVPNLPTSFRKDKEIVENILFKYLEWEAVQFFISQMKLAGKTHNKYRWKDDDKLFALNLLRKTPTEYSILFQKFLLPSDKSLEKFVRKLQS